MQSVPLYLSEIAPPKLRGALNFMFQLATTSGILIAQLVNYGESQPYQQQCSALLTELREVPPTPRSLFSEASMWQSLDVLRPRPHLHQQAKPLWAN